MENIIHWLLNTLKYELMHKTQIIETTGEFIFPLKFIHSIEIPASVHFHHMLYYK